MPIPLDKRQAAFEARQRAKMKATKWEAMKDGGRHFRTFSIAQSAHGNGFQLTGEVFTNTDSITWYLQPTGRKGRIPSKATINLKGPVHPASKLDAAKRAVESAARDLMNEIRSSLGEV